MVDDESSLKKELNNSVPAPVAAILI